MEFIRETDPRTYVASVWPQKKLLQRKCTYETKKKAFQENIIVPACDKSCKFELRNTRREEPEDAEKKLSTHYLHILKHMVEGTL